MKTILAMAAGAALAYLFDPVSGRSRRARLADQAAARMRDGAEEAVRRGRYEMGRAQGLIHEMGADTDHPEDDQQLLQKVRSEAVGPSAVATSDIEIDVNDGEVILRGASRDPVREKDLVRRISDVTGVRRVRNELTSTRS